MLGHKQYAWGRGHHVKLDDDSRNNDFDVSTINNNRQHRDREDVRNQCTIIITIQTG